MKHKIAICRIPLEKIQGGLWRLPDETWVVAELKKFGIPMVGKKLCLGVTVGELYRARYQEGENEEAVFVWVQCLRCDVAHKESDEEE